MTQPDYAHNRPRRDPSPAPDAPERCPICRTLWRWGTDGEGHVVAWCDTNHRAYRPPAPTPEPAEEPEPPSGPGWSGRCVDCGVALTRRGAGAPKRRCASCWMANRAARSQQYYAHHRAERLAYNRHYRAAQRRSA